MNRLILNLSMIGKESTGLSVYAMNCTREIERSFKCTMISSIYQGKSIISSPVDIRIGASKYASLKRLFYSKFLYPKGLEFIYTPTHHGFLGHQNQVVTIHDLICIHYPNQHKSQYYYFKYILPHIIKKCKGIFTVSYTVKKDICKYYHLSEDFVQIISNAISEEIVKIDEKNNEVKENEKPYLLVVGAGYPHKNIHELLKMHKYWYGKYTLKIVSHKGEYGRYLESIVREENLEEKVEFLGIVSRNRLVELYRNCNALVYPSLLEGFGIPPLEALLYKKPIILSDIEVFREVFEDAGIYIKVQNSKSWKNAFEILQKKDVIQQKIERGNRILKKYNWKENGEKLREILLYLEPGLKGALKNEYR